MHNPGHCGVPQCNSYRNPKDGISMFHLPKEVRGSSLLLKKWSDALRMEKEFPKQFYICSLHFESNQVLRRRNIGDARTRPILVRGAFPSKNLPKSIVAPNKTNRITSNRRKVSSFGKCQTSEDHVKVEDLNKIAGIKEDTDVENDEDSLSSKNVGKTDMNPMAELMQCVQFAALKHKNQRRRDPNKTPYINHPINVATILAVEGGIDDKEVLQAALLHDTVEDTETTLEEIEFAFGKNVAEIVREVTDDKSLPKQERKRLQIVHAKTSSKKAKLVKLADKLDNLRDLVNVLPIGWTEERREEYFVWAKKVVDNLRGTNETIESKLDDIFEQKNLLQ